MLNTAASCCNSSSGSGDMALRAPECSDKVVKEPTKTPIETQLTIFSF